VFDGYVKDEVVLEPSGPQQAVRGDASLQDGRNSSDSHVDMEMRDSSCSKLLGGKFGKRPGSMLNWASRNRQIFRQSRAQSPNTIDGHGNRD
jgi:hypothetical protein